MSMNGTGTEIGGETAGWEAEAGGEAHGISPDLRQIMQQLPQLERRARTLTRNHADAADLVQDTLEKALRALPRLRPGSNVAAWLETLLSHTFIDRRRWAARRLNWISVGQVDVPAPEEETPPAWMEIGAADVRAAVARLPPGFAAIFELHAFKRLRYAEIAARLGIPSGTVGTRLRRARQRLKQILEAEVIERPAIPLRERAAAVPVARPAAKARPARQATGRARVARAVLAA